MSGTTIGPLGAWNRDFQPILPQPRLTVQRRAVELVERHIIGLTPSL